MQYIEERYKRIDKLEARYTRLIRIALLRELELLLALVVAGASIDVVVAHVSTKTLKPILAELYEKVIVAEAKHEYVRLQAEQKALPGLPVTEWLRRAKNFIAVESSAKIVAITTTTRNQVKKVLKESATAGHSIADTARNMRQKITAFSIKRSKTLASTELIGAMNFGSLTGAQTTKLQLDKIWLATADSRTRETHNTANGQTVDVNGFFVVGGMECRFPADPMLSAGERIRCRCTQIFKPKPRLMQGEIDF